MYEEENEEAPLKSKYNSAYFINENIAKLWNQADTHAQNKNYSAWNDVLDRIWCILGADTEENDENVLAFSKLNKKLMEIGDFVHLSSGFNKVKREHLERIKKQKIALMDKELFLRRLQNKQGKGTAYEEEDDFMD